MMLNKRFLWEVVSKFKWRKSSRKLKSGKDEGAYETKFTVFYKNVLITRKI